MDYTDVERTYDTWTCVCVCVCVLHGRLLYRRILRYWSWIEHVSAWLSVCLVTGHSNRFDSHTLFSLPF
jgi:hypothetical protein